MEDLPAVRRTALFFEIHRDNPREGPGCFEATRRAFASLGDVPPTPLILDVGCGPGKQTLDLAQLSHGHIVAVDNHIPFLRQLAAELTARDEGGRIIPVLADMRSLPFRENTFDILWAEGSISIVGVAQALALWHPLLKTGGCLAFTELTWLSPHPSPGVCDYWTSAYPPMKDIQGNLHSLQGAGFDIVETFPLPASAWWDDYYRNTEKKAALLRSRHPDDPDVDRVCTAEEEEINIWRRFSDQYGYVFYTGRKR